jgi:ABC-2 type transport system permease protein
MSDALRAEWTKLRTLASTGWLLVGTVVLTIGASAAVAAATHVSGENGQDPTKLALIGVYLGQSVVVVLAVLTIAEEYGTGMMRVTLAALPRRLVLLGAKVANVVGLTFVAALIALVGCLVVGRFMLPADGLNPAHGYAFVSITHAATLRAATGSVLYLILIALFSVGVATAVRDTGASIGLVLGLLYLPPILAQVVAEPLRQHLLQIAPMSAGLAVQASTSLRDQPITPWAGLGVLAAWATVSLLVGGLLLRRRDA